MRLASTQIQTYSADEPVLTLSCPRCNILLDELKVGMVNATCGKCRYAYRAFYGTLAMFSSERVMTSSGSKYGGPSYGREYQLEVDIGGGELHRVDFSTASPKEWVKADTSDLVIVLYTVSSDGRVEDLVSITNMMGSRRYTINQPGSYAAGSAAWLAFFALCGAFLITWAALHYRMLPSVILSLLAAGAVYALSVRFLQPRRR